MTILRHAILSLVLTLLVTQVATLAGCAAVSNDPRVRTPGTIFDDEVIESMVKREIRNSNAAFDSAHLVTVSYNGIVLLAGQVESEALKAEAQQAAERIGKARSIHNELEVGGPISYVARSADSWLTTKVKSKLLANKQTEASKVKVITENGVVYLMGLLPRAEADAAVDVARSVYGVQKIVKVFEYLE